MSIKNGLLELKLKKNLFFANCDVENLNVGKEIKDQVPQFLLQMTPAHSVYHIITCTDQIELQIFTSVLIHRSL